MVHKNDQVSFIYLYSYLFCVGFSSPIDFNPGAMTNLLVTSQQVVQGVLDIFSRQYYLPSPAESSTAKLRTEMEKTLNSEVLPRLDVTLMSVGAMERHLGDHIYINNSTATTQQLIGSCSSQTPYVFVTNTKFSPCTLALN